MSYSAQAALSNDTDFINRVAACAATIVPHTHQPTVWAREHIWWVSAAPGFANAYDFAINQATPIVRPGNNASVITDAQILSAVTNINNNG